MLLAAVVVAACNEVPDKALKYVNTCWYDAVSGGEYRASCLAGMGPWSMTAWPTNVNPPREDFPMEEQTVPLPARFSYRPLNEPDGGVRLTINTKDSILWSDGRIIGRTGSNRFLPNAPVDPCDYQAQFLQTNISDEDDRFVEELSQIGLVADVQLLANADVPYYAGHNDLCGRSIHTGNVPWIHVILSSVFHDEINDQTLFIETVIRRFEDQATSTVGGAGVDANGAVNYRIALNDSRIAAHVGPATTDLGNGERRRIALDAIPMLSAILLYDAGLPTPLIHNHSTVGWRYAGANVGTEQFGKGKIALDLRELSVFVDDLATNVLPKGFIERSGGTMSGWTCDANEFSQALEVHLYATNAPPLCGNTSECCFVVDGAGGDFVCLVGGVVASIPREPAVAHLCGNAANHGFTSTFASLGVPSGSHVYAYAINTPAGTNVPLIGSPVVAP
jgi:hypothetical protein